MRDETMTLSGLVALCLAGQLVLTPPAVAQEGRVSHGDWVSGFNRGAGGLRCLAFTYAEGAPALPARQRQGAMTVLVVPPGILSLFIDAGRPLPAGTAAVAEIDGAGPFPLRIRGAELWPQAGAPEFFRALLGGGELEVRYARADGVELGRDLYSLDGFAAARDQALADCATATGG
ncbi:MAG: hypothetical protein AAFW69_09535 [Pseudomonadota bacterium]